jgi:hypothetical protein
MKRWATALVVASSMTWWGGLARAGFVDFEVLPGGNSTPSISYDGSGGPLVGSNLNVSSVVGEGTLQNDGTSLSATATTLSFTTGNLISTSSDTWVFGPGGTLTITGTVPDVGGSGPTLYSGTFQGDTTVINEGFGFKVVGATVSGNLDQALATYFGMKYPDTFAGGLTLLFNGAMTEMPPQGFTDHRLNSGNIAVTGLPEPASWTLLGLGAIGVLMFRKRLRSERPI